MHRPLRFAFLATSLSFALASACGGSSFSDAGVGPSGAAGSTTGTGGDTGSAGDTGTGTGGDTGTAGDTGMAAGGDTGAAGSSQGGMPGAAGANGGTSNGGTSNGGTSNGGTSNGGTSNGGTSNGGTSTTGGAGGGTSAGSGGIVGSGGSSGTSAGGTIGTGGAIGGAGAPTCVFDSCHEGDKPPIDTCDACTTNVCSKLPACCSDAWTWECVLLASKAQGCTCQHLSCSPPTDPSDGGCASGLGLCNPISQDGTCSASGTPMQCGLSLDSGQPQSFCYLVGGQDACQSCSTTKACGPGLSCIEGTCVRLCCGDGACGSGHACRTDILPGGIGVCVN